MEYTVYMLDDRFVNLDTDTNSTRFDHVSRGELDFLLALAEKSETIVDVVVRCNHEQDQDSLRECLKQQDRDIEELVSCLEMLIRKAEIDETAKAEDADPTE